jgi:hypothetical protein
MLTVILGENAEKYKRTLSRSPVPVKEHYKHIA